LHRRYRFDAIVSFDLYDIGGLAWRLAYDLGIPASGWAAGSDMRQPAGSRRERVVRRAIENLDLVFYQSRELFEIAAHLLQVPPEAMPKEKHIVLSRVIPQPPKMSEPETRSRVRASLGITNDQILVLNVGAILREKGVFELLDALSLAAAQNPRICGLLLGSIPAFDDSATVENLLHNNSILKGRANLLPACSPAKVWEYLRAADIFMFGSYKEGMPNSLLEAMAMGLPSIAFSIPSVREIEAATGGVVLVPAFDPVSFSQAILQLAASPQERARIGETGRAQVMERFMIRKNMSEALQRLSAVVQKPRGSNSRSLAANMLADQVS
jgi:glycosyltransferase involved in cell wall biosynthesis